VPWARPGSGFTVFEAFPCPWPPLLYRPARHTPVAYRTPLRREGFVAIDSLTLGCRHPKTPKAASLVRIFGHRQPPYRNPSGIHNGTSGQVKRRPQASMALRRFFAIQKDTYAVNRVRDPEFRRIFLLAIYLSSRLVGLCAIRPGSIPDSVTEPVPRRLIDPGRQGGRGRADRDSLD